MIRFACPLCGSKIVAPDWKAGRRGKCAGCHQKVPVPRESDPDAMPPPDAAESEPDFPDSSEFPVPVRDGHTNHIAAEPTAPAVRKQPSEPSAPRERKFSIERLVGFAVVFCIAVVLFYWATVLVLRPGSTPEAKVWPLQDVVAQFQENRPQALEQFRGKRIVITATVVEHRPSLDGPVTVLGTRDHPVYCIPIMAVAHDFEALPPEKEVVVSATVSQRGIAILPPLPPGQKMTLDDIRAAIQNGTLPQAREEAPGGFTLRDGQLVERRP